MIELIIAVSIFIVVTTISAGGFIRALRSQRSVFALISANSNSSLTIEQMTREIRTGFNFCTAGFLCENETAFAQGGISGVKTDSLTFINERNEIITYDVRENAIRRKVGLAAVPNKITANNVNISNLEFILQGKTTDVGDDGGTNPGAGAADGQTRVTILFTAGGVGRDVENISFDFQTTVSPRALDTFETETF